MWRSQINTSQEKTIFIFLATYRGLTLVVAVAISFFVGRAGFLTWPDSILIGLVGIYSIFKIFHPLYRYGRNLLNYLDFGFDLTLAAGLILFTGGIVSPFLLYTLSPLLSSAVLFPPKPTFSVVGLLAVTLIISQMLLGGAPTTLAYSFQGLSISPLSISALFALLIGLFLLAGLPYFMNINTSQQVKMQAISQERKRLSRDMHDGVAQTLGIIRWRLQLTAKKLAAGNDQQALNDIGEINRMVGGAQQEVRASIEQLRHNMDGEQGFVPALAQYITEFNENYNIECKLNLDDGKLSLPVLAEFELLCVVQEALTNIRRHAQASNVEISFSTEDKEAVLRIKDDGRGFDAKTVSRGYGFVVMGERAKSIGANFSLTTSPGCGTEIIVSLPNNSRNKFSGRSKNRVFT